jgi:hypothetical protein
VRALTRLRDAYAAGHLSTGTLEARVELALAGDAEAAVWDLPRWWQRGRAPRALVVDGVEWPLGGGTRVGRCSDCDLVLSDDTVSRRHVEIAVRGGVCALRDLGSCNGTYLNGRPVERARLRRGDVLLLGETIVRVR